MSAAGSRLAMDDAAKLPGEHVHHTTGPDATLRRIQPLLRQLGITRVADLTGLDVIGLPVAAAIRPNSRSLAVHQGKGLTSTAAKISAIMEAAEAYHAEFVDRPLRWGAADTLSGRTIDPATLPLARPDVDPRSERILWIEGLDLSSGESWWVPYETVHLDYSLPQPAGSGIFQATSNGLAAGNHVFEAMVHGLYEVIERDAVSLWHAAHAHGDVPPRTVPEVADHPTCAGLLARLARHGLQVGLWDVTSDLAVPTFLCLVVPAQDEPSGVEAELGYGCHLDPVIALSRAITEAIQGRVTRISGARDDFTAHSYGPSARAQRLAEARRWLSQLPGKPTACGDRPRPGDTLRHDLETLLSCLQRRGLDRAIWVDLSRDEIGLPVGRIIVPGLEGPWLAEDEHVPGSRARAIA